MMKTKNMFWAALSMTAALVMTACSSDDNMMTPAAPQAEVKTIPYSVTVNEGAATNRATVADDMKTLKFATGDKLYISGKDISGVLTLKSGDEGKSSGATFEGDLTYTGEGSPANSLLLTAALVGTNNKGWNIEDGKVTIFSYPNNAYCADVNEAVEEYSLLIGNSTYGDKSFTLSQQTAFLNFEITFEDGTAAGTPLTTVVSNNGSAIATANVTTTTDGGKVVAKFVLPVRSSVTTLSGATVKMGDKAARAINDATLDGKVYNVKKTQKATATAHTLTASVVGDVVDTNGKAYTVDDTHELPSGVTAVAMVAYKSATAGSSLAIALADEGTMNWATAKSTCEGKTAIGGNSWKLPTKNEWKNMFSAFGGSDSSYSGLNTALATAGGDSSKLQVNHAYWSSTPLDENLVWGVYILVGGADWFDDGVDYLDCVRACLAF